MTTGIYDKLAESCDGRLGLGTGEDAVCGVVPTFVAAPGSAGDTAALLRVADAHGLSVIPRGAGTKLHWGTAPGSCDLIVDLSRLDRVLDHTEGDMVVEVEAGRGLGELAEVLASKNQRLSAEVPGYEESRGPDRAHDSGTVGGLIATACSGPRRHSLGAVRDLLLGVTMVRADGVVASSGGRVVKNVAGYDLGKLLTGSAGTLGIIVSATFRLHPLPETTAWVTATARDPRTAADRVTDLINGRQEPNTIEIDRSANDAPITLSAGFDGTARPGTAVGRSGAEVVGDREGGAVVRAGRAAAGIDGTVAAEPVAWHGLWPGGPDGTLVAVTVPPAALAFALDAIGEAARAAEIDVPVRGSAGIGLVHAAVPPGTSPEAVPVFVSLLRDRIASRDGNVVVVHAPAAVRERVDMWGSVDAGALALMRRVKDQFDPRRLLSPGRFVAGI